MDQTPLNRGALLIVRSLSRVYTRGPERVWALREVTLVARSGEVTLLLGPSGSGKTTLLSILAGWERADGGEVAWGSGLDPTTPARWSELSMVPQSLGLAEELTVRENVELPVRLASRTLDRHDGDPVERLLSALGLAEVADRLPREVSVGEQQRAAVARALVLAPRLLLADEPTGHQDTVWTRRVFRLLGSAARAGTGCLVATHDAEAVRYADRVLRIRDGRIFATEQPPAQTPPHR